MLDIQLLTMKFGGLTAVNEVTLKVGQDEIVGLIGPNGAGKTTVFNCITGIYTPTDGHVSFTSDTHTHVINTMKTYNIIKAGMARTFQNVRLFSQMTVLENVLVGLHSQFKSNILNIIFNRDSFLREEQKAIAKAYEILAYFDLQDLADMQANALPFGRQKVLELARALISSPKLLLLDEPVAGLNTVETNFMMKLIRKIQKEFSLSVLLIEHDMRFVMNLCSRIYVMDHGELFAEDVPAKIQTNKQVIAAYLGEPDYEHI